jgi:hypothetical protein
MDSQVLPRQAAVDRRSGRKPWWAVAWAAAGIILFFAYLRLSSTYAENSDMANILLMGWDMAHGNVLLRGWHMSDVSFYPTELVQYALLESVLGLRMTTAHVAAAMTYTLVVLLAVLLARGGASGREALVRTAIAGGIMVAPQLSAGVYAVDLAVGHIGSSVPLLLGWLLLDREPRRWWVPALLAVILAWVLVADPIAEITGIAPLALIAGGRFAWKLAARQRPDWYAAALAGAALASYALARVIEALLRALGGYVVSPVPVQFRSPAGLVAAAPALWRVLVLFGADFHGMRAGLPFFLAVSHLVGMGLVLGALGRACRRDTPFVDQVLAVGIAANLFLYLATTASTQGAHEIAVVLPYAAALAGRMLANWTPGSLARNPARSRHLRRRSAYGSRRPLALAGALLLSVYLSGLGYELTFPAAPPAGSPLASWLVAHDLRAGLAGYWESSSVTVDTGGLVKVRAVTSSLSPYLWMTDTAWYDPAVSTDDFVVLSKPSSCELVSLHDRFGEPASTYQADGYTILSWHRNLLRGQRSDGHVQPPAGPTPPWLTEPRAMIIRLCLSTNHDHAR